MTVYYHLVFEVIFDKFIGLPVSDFTRCYIESILLDIDRFCVINNKITFYQLYLHCMGIKDLTSKNGCINIQFSI